MINQSRALSAMLCIGTVFALAASGVLAAAASGAIAFRVRDSTTGYAVSATVVVQGARPGQFAPATFATDELGRFQHEFPAGEYLVEVSAPGYEPARLALNVGSAPSLPGTVNITAADPPKELRPEVLNPRFTAGRTLMHGYIVDEETGKPLAGVRIRLEKSSARAVTDDRGYFAVSVPTPPPTGRDVPGTETLFAELAGYKMYSYSNFPVGPEGLRFKLELLRGSGADAHDGTHKLMQPGQAEGRPAPEPSSSGPHLSPEAYGWLGTPGGALLVGTVASADAATLVAITVPTSIVVGYDPSQENQYCTCAKCCPKWKSYKLEVYVQDGLDDEWYSSWDANALKAGAVAYRSYGAYFVKNSISSKYNVCNSPAFYGCQALNDQTTPTATVTAAKATAGSVLSADGANVFFAEYAAETNGWPECGNGYTGSPSGNWPCMKDLVCTGTTKSGHPRGMCQWGSQRWATGKDATGSVVTTPKDWRCILDHYYNDNYNSTGTGTNLRTAYINGGGGDDNVAFIVSNYIYTMNGDGSHQTKVGNGVVGAQPTWAPGGGKIAYTNGSIWSMNTDGSNQTQLTSSSTPVDRNPNWSINHKIAFSSDRNNPPDNQDIFVMNEDGSGMVQRTSSGDRNMDLSPVWSPDATKIAFCKWVWADSDQDTFVMNADGSGQTQLTFDTRGVLYAYICSAGNGNSCGPTWSPDGTRIAFTSNLAGQDPNIFVMNSDGSGQAQHTSSGFNDCPSWSVDGKRIFFERYSGAGWDLWVLNVDGSSSPIQLTSFASQFGNRLWPACMSCGRFDIP